VASPGAGTLRRAYAGALNMVGDHLLHAGLGDLAVAKFKEALLFDGNNPELQRKAELTPRERQEYAERARRRPSDRSAPRTTADDRAKGLAASLFVAAREGNISEARTVLRSLNAVDRGGINVARVADALRAVARTAWTDGRGEEARSLYALVYDLDRADSEARERSRPAGSAAVAVAVAPPPPAAEPARTLARKAWSEAPESSPEAPRNPAVSRAAAEVGVAALGKGWLDEADNAFRKAVRADSLNPVAVGGMAEVAFERARYTEALDFGRRAARLAPRSPHYLVVVGDAYFKLLRFDDARAAYERALSLAPRDELLQARIQRVKARTGER
jgi:tetratricopeptide (TPR) repeat protein